MNGLQVIWRPPKKPNGYITQYKLVELTLQRTTNFSNTQRQHNITGEYICKAATCVILLSEGYFN